MRTVDMILILMLIVVIGMLFIDMYRLKQEGGKCLANPLTYGLQKASKTLKQEVSCYCNNGLTINTTGAFQNIGSSLRPGG